MVIIILLGGLYLSAKENSDSSVQNTTKKKETVFDNLKAVVYKSPECGCCVGFSAEARKQGMDVEIISTEDMQKIKDKHNIPRNMESCHTTIIGKYFIEGHVPFEVIEKLLTEKPEIDGIALPNMPAGTPGMPGSKEGPYEIFQLTDGVYSEFITI